MDPDNIQNNNPSSKKPFIIIGGILVLLTLILIIIVALTQSKKITTSQSEKTGSPANQPSFNQTVRKVDVKRPVNKDLAKIVINWMSKVKTRDNTYPQDETCLYPTQCQTTPADNTQAAFIIAGYFKYWEKTKDQATLTLLNSALDTYSNNKTVPTIQNSLWNCRLLYEIWDNPLLDKNQKDKVQVVCARGLYYPSLTDKIDEDISKGLVNDLNLSLFQDKPYDPGDTSIKTDDLIPYAAYSSDNSSTSVWNKILGDLKNNAVDQKKAVAYFNRGVKAFGKDQKLAGITAAPYLLGIAALDIYKTNNQKQYLSYGEYIFNKYKMVPCETLERCAFKAFFYSELYKATNDKKYQLEKDSLINTLCYDHFDQKETKGFFDYKQTKVYPLRANALMVYLLME